MSIEEFRIPGGVSLAFEMLLSSIETRSMGNMNFMIDSTAFVHLKEGPDLVQLE